MHRACRSILALLFLALLAGCGDEKSVAKGTPRATAEAFVDALRGGDYDAAAAGFDYDQWARHENPDWESFAPQARKEIIAKLQEDKAAELKSLAGVISGEVTVGDAVTRGDRATVPLIADGVTLRLHLLNQDGLWYLLTIEEGTG